jgi:uncharacterized membrane protein YbhN (UPF0104 family)
VKKYFVILFVVSMLVAVPLRMLRARRACDRIGGKFSMSGCEIQPCETIAVNGTPPPRVICSATSVTLVK